MAAININLSNANKELKKAFPNFSSGDTINVHIKIQEGGKERIQQFQGTVLQRKNVGSNGESFTIRKISDSIAVEKIIPIFSPSIDKIELIRKGKVRRARIFYLRDRKGKRAKIKEKI
jgi:large subunit ribosomal protein L19